MTKAEKLYVLSLARYFSNTVVSEVVYTHALAAQPAQIQAIFSLNRHRLVSVLEKAGQLAKYKRAVLIGRSSPIMAYRSRLDAQAFVLFDSADFLLPARAAPAARDLEPEAEHEETREAADVAVGLGVCFLLLGRLFASLIEVRVQVAHADSQLALGDKRIAQLAFAGLLRQHKVSFPASPDPQERQLSHG